VEAVTVESATDVAAAVDFAREHNLRLLVLGGWDMRKATLIGLGR
jgi:hypothetical protein